MVLVTNANDFLVGKILKNYDIVFTHRIIIIFLLVMKISVPSFMPKWKFYSELDC